MATLGATVGTTAVDVTSELTNSAGTTTALSAATSYILQNAGQQLLFMHEGASAADFPSEYWHIVAPGQIITIETPSSDNIYVRCRTGETRVVVTESI